MATATSKLGDSHVVCGCPGVWIWGRGLSQPAGGLLLALFVDRVGLVGCERRAASKRRVGVDDRLGHTPSKKSVGKREWMPRMDQDASDRRREP